MRCAAGEIAERLGVAARDKRRAALARNPNVAATLPRQNGGINPPLLEIICNLRELIEGGFQVVGDFGGDESGAGKLAESSRRRP